MLIDVAFAMTLPCHQATEWAMRELPQFAKRWRRTPPCSHLTSAVSFFEAQRVGFHSFLLLCCFAMSEGCCFDLLCLAVAVGCDFVLREGRGFH